MKIIDEKKPYVISKMNSFLKQIVPNKDSFYSENWLHNTSNTVNNLSEFKVNYGLNYNNSNAFLEIGDYLSFHHNNTYQCTSCQKLIKKLYSGFCYVCLTKKAAADMCVLNPYLCHFAKGTCREPEWGLSFCYQPHYVYLSYTDKFKVGITRKNQIFTRWVDQGATMGSPICLAISRHQSGTIEKLLTEILADKSHWLKMLKSGNKSPSEDEFKAKFNSVIIWLKDIFAQKKVDKSDEIILFENPMIAKINYPVQTEVENIKSINLQKQNKIDAPITGIKGQYIFFGDHVFNIRSHEGFIVQFEKY